MLRDIEIIQTRGKGLNERGRLGNLKGKNSQAFQMITCTG